MNKTVIFDKALSDIYLFNVVNLKKKKIFLDPCSEHECADGGVCQLNEVRAPVCKCGPPCDLLVRPGSAVCGSDYRDYPSECALRRESCRTRQQLTIAYRGECASGNNLF